MPSCHPPVAGAPLENLLPVVVDVSNEDVCQQFVGGCVQRYGRIDHAVACFGGFWEGGKGRLGTSLVGGWMVVGWGGFVWVVGVGSGVGWGGGLKGAASCQQPCGACSPPLRQ